MLRDSPILAFAVAVLAIGFLSAMDAAVKAVSIDYGAFSALAWRFAIGALLLAPLYLVMRRDWPSRRAMRYHLLRGLVGIPMSFLFFYGLTYVPMGQAIALAFIAPLLSLFLAALLLGEAVGKRSLSGSSLAFVGVLVIFAGQAHADLGREALIGSIAIIGSAVLYAFNIILMRQQALNARPLEIAFSLYLIAAIGYWLAAVVVGPPPFPAGQEEALWLSVILGVLGMMVLAFAYARAKASYLGASEYSGFLWAIAFGFMVFGEIPSPFTIAGAALIVAGCWIAARAEPVDRALIEA